MPYTRRNESFQSKYHRQRDRRPPKKYEDYAVVLDIIPIGVRQNQHELIIQALGTKYFTLLEIIPKPNVTITPLETVGIGKETREKIKTISERISFDKLTNDSQDVLEEAILQIINANPKRFVDFFNKAQPITIKMHSLELIPGIGKKTMKQILEERKELPFMSFEEITERVGIPDPQKLIAKRIIQELQGNEKYYLFTRGTPQQT